jgi:hypothetical protein
VFCGPAEYPVRIRQRLNSLLDGVRSYRASLKASGLYGRSLKLGKAGRAREALEAALEGLLVLSAPIIKRQGAPEGSVVTMLTIQVEHLAHALGAAGANRKDLADACQFLRSLPEPLKGQVAEIKRDWLPYLEARLAEPNARA